jgi:hypothetical protein
MLFLLLWLCSIVWSWAFYPNILWVHQNTFYSTGCLEFYLWMSKDGK